MPFCSETESSNFATPLPPTVRKPVTMKVQPADGTGPDGRQGGSGFSIIMVRKGIQVSQHPFSSIPIGESRHTGHIKAGCPYGRETVWSCDPPSVCTRSTHQPKAASVEANVSSL
uniref:Uncharacterized protein n=1 Tax=Micrurus lemniscatus lemniscatus TaxID=129467 RepID=A0A2D4IJV1_MICLE